MTSSDSKQPGPRTRVRRADDLLATEVADGMVLMDPEKGLYFGLDLIGTDIWRRLASPVLASDLVAALVRDYEAPAAQVERDVLVLLARMFEHGLVSEC